MAQLGQESSDTVYHRAHQPSPRRPHSVISSQPAVFASSGMSEHPILMLSSSSRELLKRAEAKLRPVRDAQGHAGAELGLLEPLDAPHARTGHALSEALDTAGARDGAEKCEAGTA